MRKPIAIIVGVLSLSVLVFGTRPAIDWLRSEPSVSADIATRRWVEQVLIVDSVSIDVPWPLERAELPLPPQVSKLLTRSLSLARNEDGLDVLATVMSLAPGTPANLDGAADGALANIRNVPGTHTVDGTKRETSVLGVRAIELDALIDREQGEPLRLRGVVLLLGNDLLELVLISRSDQPLGEAAWERMRASLRSTKGAEPLAAASGDGAARRYEAISAIT